MEDIHNNDTENTQETNNKHQKKADETVVIKGNNNILLIIILILLLFSTLGIVYLVYTTATHPSYGGVIQKATELPFDSHKVSELSKVYSIQEINGNTVIFNTKSGEAYYPETGIRIAIDDYIKKRAGQIFTSTITIPSSTDLYIEAQTKAAEDTILYSLELRFTESLTSLTVEEIDQKIEILRDSSNNNILYLNFYDKDGFFLFSKKVTISGGTKIVNSMGYGIGLHIESSFTEDPVLIGLISKFDISWNIPVLD